MKKKAIIIFVLILITFKVVANENYFDVGLGLGLFGQTEYDDTYFADDSFANSISISYDASFKYGFKIIKKYPLYLVGNFSVFGKTVENDDNEYLMLNSYLIGPGVVAYPFPFLQVSTCFGYSFSINKSNWDSVEFEDGKGLAANATIAYEYKDKANNKALIGAGYSISRNINDSDSVEKLSVLSVFIKYSYRLDDSGFFLNTQRVN